MPLERATGMFSLDPEDSSRILFPMTDGQKQVMAAIACDALDALGEPGADPLLVFTNNRSSIEELASTKFDANGASVEIVELTEEDLENWSADSDGLKGEG